MIGPPDDVEGQCNARFRVADDWLDNEHTFLCELEPGHEGDHVQTAEYAVMQWRNMGVADATS
jgi:hypothetical protein